MTDDRPRGPLSSVVWEFNRQLAAAQKHAAAEGKTVSARTVLESYDRTLHPWMHGRRPSDLAEKYGDQIEFVGFVIGAALSVLIYGPGRLVSALRRWLP